MRKELNLCDAYKTNIYIKIRAIYNSKTLFYTADKCILAYVQFRVSLIR